MANYYFAIFTNFGIPYLLILKGAVATTYFGDNSVRSAVQDSLQEFKGLYMQTSRIKSTVFADLFASISFSAQYGMFQRRFLDLTRFSARMDFHSGSKFLSGAMLLIDDLSNSRHPSTESVKATLPNARFSLQQQVCSSSIQLLGVWAKSIM